MYSLARHGERIGNLSILFIVLAPVLLILAGCRTNRNAMYSQYPDDLYIVAVTGSLVPGESNRQLEIDADGQASFSILMPGRPGPPVENSSFEISSDHVEALWSELVEQNFFGLDGLYVDDRVDDGWLVILTVTANSRTHRVEVENVLVPGVTEILRTLDAVLPAGKSFKIEPINSDN